MNQQKCKSWSPLKGLLAPGSTTDVEPSGSEYEVLDDGVESLRQPDSGCQDLPKKDPSNRSESEAFVTRGGPAIGEPCGE